jgi:transglutaminase-like putative cysteine protease
MKRIKGSEMMSATLLLATIVFAIGAVTPGRSAGATKAGAASAEVPTRHFEFTYQAHVPAVPDARAPLRIWIRVPSSSDWQTISALTIDAPVRYKISKENEFGNQMAYWEVKPGEFAAPFDITLHFTVVHREHKVDLTHLPTAANQPAPDSAEFARFLKPDRLVPIDGMIGDLSREQTAGAITPLEKARKVYEYVIATMKYDKTGSGWGEGDAIWACTAKRGNCSDFHALFDGMARAAGIPARFEIGFPLTEGKPQDRMTSYHC